MKINLADCYCSECGTDLEWWHHYERKKVYRIENDDMFCSKTCFKKYSLTFWNLTEIKGK